MQRTLGQLLENEEMMVKVAFKKAGTVNGRELDDRNEVKSFKAVGDVDAGADARSALLP